jgi:1,4-dihydroxy-2-naphthoyl-CoA hydrolase
MKKLPELRPEIDIPYLEALGVGRLPGLLGMRVDSIEPGRLVMSLAVRSDLHAGNGFLHAGAIVSLADNACGYGSMAHLPVGSTGFTTVELKSNHLATALDGTIRAEGRATHLGRTTQVWDATVTHVESGRTLALFRCTQMVLWPK